MVMVNMHVLTNLLLIVATRNMVVSIDSTYKLNKKRS